MVPHHKFHLIKKSLRESKFFHKMEIDPELAADLLSLNTHNRKLKTEAIDEMAEDMRKGKWKYNGEMIQISISGVLLNGQNRLHAIIKSKTTQLGNIETGLPDEVFSTIDVGTKRSASDTFHVDGVERSGTTATAVKMIANYNSGVLKTGSARQNKISNSDLLDYYHKLNKEVLNWAVDLMLKLTRKGRHLHPGVSAGILYLLSLKDKEQAEYFMHLLALGDNIGPNNHSMIYLLREKLIKLMNDRSKTRLEDKVALIIKGWNFFRENKEIKILVYAPGKEDYPKIR